MVCSPGFYAALLGGSQAGLDVVSYHFASTPARLDRLREKLESVSSLHGFLGYSPSMSALRLRNWHSQSALMENVNGIRNITSIVREQNKMTRI